MPNATTQRGTFFFRRTEEKSVDQEFSAVPPEFRRVLAAAEMTPDEAAAMVDWLKAQKLDSPAQLEVIDRLLQARRHQITLAQLFGMSDEEAAAFREVVKQVGGDYERLVSLATSDLLTPTERKAVDKATSVVTDLRRLTEELPMDVQTRVSVYGRAASPWRGNWSGTRSWRPMGEGSPNSKVALDCSRARREILERLSLRRGRRWPQRRGGNAQHPALRRRRHVAVAPPRQPDDEAVVAGACCWAQTPTRWMKPSARRSRN